MGSYWNAYYTFITDLSATNTTMPVIQGILQYIYYGPQQGSCHRMSWGRRLSVW